MQVIVIGIGTGLGEIVADAGRSEPQVYMLVFRVTMRHKER